MPKGTGFTLIELIISVAIAGIITVIAIPSFNNLINRNRLDSATSDFLHSLALARSKAAYLNTKVAVIPNGTNWNNGWTVFEDINSDNKIDRNEIVFLQHGPLNNHIHINAGKTINSYIAYLPNGYTAPKNNAYLMDTIVFCVPGVKVLSRKLIINFSGRVRSEDLANTCST